MTHFESGYINFMKLAGLSDKVQERMSRALRRGATVPAVAAAGVGTVGLHRRLTKDEDPYKTPDNLPEHWGLDPKAQLMLLALNAHGR